MASDGQPQAAVPRRRGERVLPLPAAVLYSFSQKKHGLPSVLGPFSETERSDPRVFVCGFPQNNLEKWQSKKIGWTDPATEAGCRLDALPKSFLALFAIKIWLKPVSREVRGSGELKIRIKDKECQRKYSRCFFTLETRN